MDEFDTLRKEVLGGDGTITVIDPATGRKITVDLTKNIVSRSFQTNDPLDRIWDVMYMPQKVDGHSLCLATEEEINYLISLANCTVTAIPDKHFSNFFPSEALVGFRDDYGVSLREEAAIWYGNNDYRYYDGSLPFNSGLVANFTTNPKVSDADACVLYLRLYLLPRFSAWLAGCFSALCFYAREAEARRHAEGEAFCHRVTEIFAQKAAQSTIGKASAATKDTSPSNFDPHDYYRLGCGGLD